MRTVVATALVLLLTLFLCPLVLLGGGGDVRPAEDPAPTATLPLDRTVVEPPAKRADQSQLVRVLLPDGTVASLTMADYLWRVVAAEMPASFEPEALKAQAVTARTYTLYKMAHGPVSNHPDADVCTDITCCQAYIDPAAAAANWGDAAPKYVDKITAAVADTDGQAVLYQGQPIDAVFFSSAAGETRDAVEVWGSAVPYLTGVDSPEGDEVPNYRSTVTIPAEEFKAAFAAQHPEADLSGPPSGWLGTDGDPLSVGGVAVKKTALRAMFNLRSASFTATAGEEGVTFSVTGYGHGVGMSQYGANAMAKEGKSYVEILTHYYTGVSVG